MHHLAVFQRCCVVTYGRFYQLSDIELKQTLLMPLWLPLAIHKHSTPYHHYTNVFEKQRRGKNVCTIFALNWWWHVPSQWNAWCHNSSKFHQMHWRKWKQTSVQIFMNMHKMGSGFQSVLCSRKWITMSTKSISPWFRNFLGQSSPTGQLIPFCLKMRLFTVLWSFAILLNYQAFHHKGIT